MCPRCGMSDRCRPPIAKMHGHAKVSQPFAGWIPGLRWVYDPGWEKRMASRRRRLDPVGPFGNPDGSRADIEDLISEFVDFGGNPAYCHLGARANDSMVRVIVGKLGAGKTVYLRRLEDIQAHQDSVYADVPQQSLPRTEV